MVCTPSQNAINQSKEFQRDFQSYSKKRPTSKSHPLPWLQLECHCKKAAMSAAHFYIYVFPLSEKAEIPLSIDKGMHAISGGQICKDMHFEKCPSSVHLIF